MPASDKRPRAEPAYYALVVPGTEEIAAGELVRTGAMVSDALSRIDKRQGILLFAAADIRRVFRCGTLEDVFQIVLDTPTPGDKAAPKLLAREIDAAAFAAAALAHHALRPKKHGRTYKIIARVAGRQPFRREDIESAFDRAIAAMLPRWNATRGPAAMEVWVHVVGERTIAGIRLSGDELGQRAYKQAHLPASLKPTVARALVLMSEPKPDDVVLDPMCGAGTILRERADAGHARLVLGGDSAPDALDAARVNAGRHAALQRWDATRLPIRSGCIDAIVTNPPYGRQHEAVAGLDRLYSRSLREAARVLRPDGRCVVLTGEPSILMRALPSSLRLRAKRRLLLRGLAVTAFVLVRE
ncbi:MAG: methyltransferase domain-containing protein [Chloroflexota bacterium]|nr:methyltransferase domain-containing protein [Chloroflexota bacterium]